VNLTLDVDTKYFDAMVRELSRVCSAPPDEVLREEVGRVLSQALKNTKAASVSGIKEHSANAKFVVMPASLYKPKRRRVAGGKIVYNLNRRYPAALWNAIQKARAIDLKRRLAARGLAKQSWYKLGLLLGVAVEAPDYVKNAVPTTGKTYKDERVDVQKGDASNVIKLETTQPTLVAIDGEGALQRAVQGRIAYFYKNVTKDVFGKLADIAKKYPGITIN
jgi:hypothetical protein